VGHPRRPAVLEERPRARASERASERESGGRGSERESGARGRGRGERERKREREGGDTYTRAYTQESGVKYAGEARIFAGTGRPIAFEF